MIKSKTHIGISGWSYYDWKEIFYPAKIKSSEWLGFYANTFNTTEINSSFYHLPRKSSVENWNKNTPDDFIFCPKLSKQITHIQKLQNPKGELENFFEVFEPLKNKIGSVLVQLPPSLKFNAETAINFYNELKKYKQYSFAMEARHSSWLEYESLELMRQYDVAFVISQSGVGFPYAEEATSNNVYVRFHGPEKLYASNYSDETLLYYAKLFCKWHIEKKALWIYFNNCYFGNAINNALKLEEMMNKILPSINL